MHADAQTADTAKTAKSAGRPAGRAKPAIDRPPRFQGWRTTDAEEIERRRWRGRTEIVQVEAQEPDHPFFGTFRVATSSGNDYMVEIRTLQGFANSCGCLDHQVNGLGTCKHIEGTLLALRQGRARRFDQAAKRGGSRVEIYLDRRDDPAVAVTWPADQAATAPVRAVLAPWLRAGDRLPGDGIAALAAIERALAEAPASVRDGVRLSRHLTDWIADRRRRAARVERKDRFLAAVERGEQSFDLLHHPLLPYQRDGMLHLAFGERALLADDMGLGKTVQAIAACELLRRQRGIARVLVVSPASLKGEWRDQIDRFSDLSVRIIGSTRAKRLADYRKPAFFYLANYEQILADGREINEILKPDVVILDEAQRIKNWQTKTARAVKGLRSPYAFVLTGTPLENRIDEVYSIVQYLDPGLLGPLFRFNREFYRLDDRGRPEDYQNLDRLRDRLKPVILRRRKADVEDQLPERTVSNYFVPMDEEQRLRYQEFEGRAARLLALARRRPLTKQQFDKLQIALACMRMMCDTPYILEPDCRVCPKLEELERILADLTQETDTKIIIFSEWVRMLELVGGLAGELGLDVAWHTGKVPQDKRRAEIHRFRNDPACRLFLSSDSGSVGLNLQAASVVINMDLPWNPAKLEQRIARAWRKHQTRSVTVINLVTEDSIEHRMVHLLAQKQELADGVLDGIGDLDAVRMPSGRAAFIERMEAMMAGVPAVETARPAAADPGERLRADLVERHGDGLLVLESRRDAAGREVVMAVLDGDPAAGAAEQRRLDQAHGAEPTDGGAPAPRIEVLDRAEYAAIQRLIDAGVLQFTGGEARELHRTPAPDADAERRRRQLARARQRFAEAERRLRMAALLAGGGFAAEARDPLLAALGQTLDAAAALSGEPDDQPDAGPADLPERARNLAAQGMVPEEAARTATALAASGNGAGPLAADRAPGLIESIERLLAGVETAIAAAES